MTVSLFALLALFVCNAAATVYMSPSGTSSPGCGSSPGSACSDWSSAAATVNELASKTGVSLVMGAGTYVLNITDVGKLGVADFRFPVHIVGGPDVVVLLVGSFVGFPDSGPAYLHLEAGGSLDRVTFVSALGEGSGCGTVFLVGPKSEQCPEILVSELSFSMMRCDVRGFKFSADWENLPFLQFQPRCYNISSILVQHNLFTLSDAFIAVYVGLAEGLVTVDISDNQFHFNNNIYTRHAVMISWLSSNLFGPSRISVTGNVVSGVGLLSGGDSSINQFAALLTNTAAISLDIQNNVIVNGTLVNWQLPLVSLDPNFPGTIAFAGTIRNNTMSCLDNCNDLVVCVDNFFAFTASWPVPTLLVSDLTISGNWGDSAVAVRGQTGTSYQLRTIYNGGLPGLVSILNATIFASPSCTGRVFDLDPRNTILVQNVNVRAGSGHVFYFLNSIEGTDLAAQYYMPSVATLENVRIYSDPDPNAAQFHVFNFRNGWLFPVIPFRVYVRNSYVEAVRLTDYLFNLAYPANVTFASSVLSVHSMSRTGPGFIQCWNASLFIDPSSVFSVPGDLMGAKISCWQCVLVGVPFATSCLSSSWWIIQIVVPISVSVGVVSAVLVGCYFYRRKRRGYKIVKDMSVNP